MKNSNLISCLIPYARIIIRRSFYILSVEYLIEFKAKTGFDKKFRAKNTPKNPLCLPIFYFGVPSTGIKNVMPYTVHLSYNSNDKVIAILKKFKISPIRKVTAIFSVSEIFSSRKT